MASRTPRDTKIQVLKNRIISKEMEVQELEVILYGYDEPLRKIREVEEMVKGKLEKLERDRESARIKLVTAKNEFHDLKRRLTDAVMYPHFQEIDRTLVVKKIMEE